MGRKINQGKVHLRPWKGNFHAWKTRRAINQE